MVAAGQGGAGRGPLEDQGRGLPPRAAMSPHPESPVFGRPRLQRVLVQDICSVIVKLRDREIGRESRGISHEGDVDVARPCGSRRAEIRSKSVGEIELTL